MKRTRSWSKRLETSPTCLNLALIRRPKRFWPNIMEVLSQLRLLTRFKSRNIAIKESRPIEMPLTYYTLTKGESFKTSNSRLPKNAISLNRFASFPCTRIRPMTMEDAGPLLPIRSAPMRGKNHMMPLTSTGTIVRRHTADTKKSSITIVIFLLRSPK